jgi:hypothetical protein
VTTGVFSLFVSCEDVVLGGLVGEDGSGGKKFSASESDGGGRGTEEGMTMGAGGGRLGIGNSSWAICKPSCQYMVFVSLRRRAYSKASSYLFDA